MSEPRNSEGLLSGYRALELADEKGLYCGKLLADLGADVIKVEPPGGDSTRFRGPFYHDEAHPEKSLYFLHFNANKRSITLDIEKEAGQVAFRELVKTADALIESFPPGHLRGLGLDYESLREINPKLVMCSITSFGQSGPHRHFKTADLVNMAVGFLSQLAGEPDRAPLRWGAEQSYHMACPSSLTPFTWYPSRRSRVVIPYVWRSATGGRASFLHPWSSYHLILFHTNQYRPVDPLTRADRPAIYKRN